MKRLKGTVEPIRDWDKIQEIKTLLIEERMTNVKYFFQSTTIIITEI